MPIANAGRGVERDQRRRPAAAGAGAAVGVAVHDHALGLEAGDDRRHRRARQAGMAREVGSAGDSRELKCLDDAQPVGRAQRRGGARLVLHPGDPPFPQHGFVKESAEVCMNLALICSSSTDRTSCRPRLQRPFSGIGLGDGNRHLSEDSAPLTRSPRWPSASTRTCSTSAAAARGCGSRPGPAARYDAVIAGRRMRLRERGRERRAGRRPERRPGHLAAHRRGLPRRHGGLPRGAPRGSAAACTWASASWPRPAAPTSPAGSSSRRSGRAISALSPCFPPGTGPETILCVHGLGGTKASFLPTVNALADALPRGRDGPARLRRVGQADRRAVRRRLVRAVGVRG